MTFRPRGVTGSGGEFAEGGDHFDEAGGVGFGLTPATHHPPRAIILHISLPQEPSCPTVRVVRDSLTFGKPTKRFPRRAAEC